MLRNIVLALPVMLVAFQSALAQVGDGEPAYYGPSERPASDVLLDYTNDACNACGANDACNACGECCGHCMLLQKHRAKQEGRNSQWLWDSCNCNGSYKFPVPPLYTYHWPGLYAQQLMTDFHSPWRFPAIRPYEDEEPGDELLHPPTPVRQVSRSSSPQRPTKSRPGGVEPVSAKMQRYYR
jgi:hypothetical protein